jgi:hypothetical protein
MADTGYGADYSGYGSTPRGKQTGSPNTKPLGASGKKPSKTLNPWGGPNIPKGSVPKGTNSAGPASSMAKPTPDPQIYGMDYKPNDPLYWPVELSALNYIRQPSTSGVNANVIAKNNAAVEHAYTRDHYQASP